MERYVVDSKKERMFRNFFQMGGEMDGYIYTQEGEGIGSFFGNLFKKVLPVATKAIKGAAHIAAPHLKEAATELAGEASKSLIRKINNNKKRQTRITDKFNPRKRRRRN